ncbi:prepilin-type N-terminal cleavage/methylation domain-containing protein [Candidatus Kaiserbacteria bacterium]|nr:prepilin-type N-terminal cleavage/methylation domain-containing protein [Candidatus Kaiserbacteria bacterium]MCA9359153.1 prepilin-type N-terminal cleavage/methylation domain-containing protein [Candidatus Kaiserbacteria bacterium]
MLNSRFVKGFTLIEILVVISIIGILSAILYASFGEARTDSKNKALRVEMKEVQLALELFKAQNGRYPDVPPCGSVGMGESFALSTSPVCITYGAYIASTTDFISDLPSHTKSANPNCVIEYRVDNANFSWYKLTAINCYGGATSAADGVQPADELARCLSTCPAIGVCDSSTAGFYESYAVYSSGGECR